jgi:ferritin-like metal-binding protein YciE
MLLKQPIKLSSTTQLTNPETAANQTGLLRFKVQSDSQVVTRQLEKALKFEVERMRRIRWQALELIATDGQTLTNNYELQLVRQLGLFSQKHENACRKIAQRLQQQCDRAGIDASVQPIST